MIVIGHTKKWVASYVVKDLVFLNWMSSWGHEH